MDAGRYLLLALAIGLVPACSRCSADRAQATPVRRGAPVTLGPAHLTISPLGTASPRMILDAPRLAELRDQARRSSPAWRAVKERCDEALTTQLGSGYQGFDWADAVADLSLCWHATGKPEYARGALEYLEALLDDRFRVGDGKGGDGVVRHDSGYGMRTFGAYAALGYDWLRGAPGMDAEVERRVAERLGKWIDWYRDHGYLRNRPLSNYYWGYLTTLSFAGLALSGEHARAQAWLERARAELSGNALPTLRDELGGGGWPEGWQYGEYTTLEIALVAEAFRTSTGIRVADQMPWLGETITQHVHALLPDEKSVYDGGTWGQHPARPSAVALSAIAVALDGVGDARAAEARWMIHDALPPLTREQVWLRLLSSKRDAPGTSPRSGPTSLHLKGQGLTFARSDWSKTAVWTSFQAGPFLAADHQDKDQGHFELWRGSDGLLVDGGDAEGSATINHNTLLVDDGGRHINYAPNQGVWGKAVRTLGFGDDGTVVAAVGDLGEAYAPSCVEEGCQKRSVERFLRTFVYVRPSLLVIDDRIRLERPSDGAIWAAHTTVAPTRSGNRLSAVVGSSRVDVISLEPADVRPGVLREPTASGEGPHRQNRPWGPMWRIQLESPTGSRERGFLTFITVDRAEAAPPGARRVEGDGLRGAVGRADSRTVAVLFADGGGSGRATLGEHADLVVVAGLDPGARYRLGSVVDVSCGVQVRLDTDASGRSPTPGGFISQAPPPCEGIR